eukprot:4026808-Amphidinium_carterae.1
MEERSLLISAKLPFGKRFALMLLANSQPVVQIGRKCCAWQQLPIVTSGALHHVDGCTFALKIWHAGF